MRVGSLFTGIGGFDLGLERAGMRVVWQCESDDFCRRVLANHWPDVPCFQDVRDLSRTAGTPSVDLLCGGFPCQDLSYAGLGAGITGARSGLWSEYARIIGELRPRYVIVENVSALLGRGLSVVLADLSALGYDAEWDCLPASAFGAPHQRDRVWLVAYPDSESQSGRPVDAQPGRGLMVPRRAGDAAHTQREQLREQPGRRDGSRRSGALFVGDHGAPRLVADAYEFGCEEGLRQRSGPDERQGPRDVERSGELQDADERSLQPWRVGGRATQAGGPGWWAVEPPVGRMAHGVPNRLDQLAALGNALVYQIAQWLGERIMSWEANTDA